MIERLLLDTNIIIYSLGGNKPVTNLISGKQHFKSELTQIELLGYHGLNSEELAVLSDYLNEVFVIGLSRVSKT